MLLDSTAVAALQRGPPQPDRRRCEPLFSVAAGECEQGERCRRLGPPAGKHPQHLPGRLAASLFTAGSVERPHRKCQHTSREAPAAAPCGLARRMVPASGAIRSGASAGTYPASYLYLNAADRNDVTSGSNDDCSPPTCAAGPGYDGRPASAHRTAPARSLASPPRPATTSQCSPPPTAVTGKTLNR